MLIERETRDPPRFVKTVQLIAALGPCESSPFWQPPTPRVPNSRIETSPSDTEESRVTLIACIHAGFGFRVFFDSSADTGWHCETPADTGGDGIVTTQVSSARRFVLRSGDRAGGLGATPRCPSKPHLFATLSKACRTELTNAAHPMQDAARRR
jgi:hypothetical protein